MPLIPPSLDDRSYDDLVQEMIASIPAHTPEWTNPQPGDPGRTLIELFAWLGDTILYRANLIPEKQRIAFLRLLGRTLQPAAAATGLLALALDPTAVAPIALAARAKVAGATPFETLGEVNLLPVTAQAYLKVPLTDDQSAAALPLLQGLRSLYTLASTPIGYTATPVFMAGQGSTGGVADPAIDLIHGTTDHSLWLALLAGKAENVAAVRSSLGDTSGQQLLSVGFVPSQAVPGFYSDIGTPAAVQATWQMSQPTSAGTSTAYTTLKVISDTTLGLTRNGIVRLQIPQSSLIGAPPNDVRSDSQAGIGMKPPRIDDPAIAARLVTWVRLLVRSEARVSWAGVNAVEIDQRTTSTNVIIGVSDGSAGQQFSLPTGQIDPATFQLDVDMPGLGFQLWRPTDDLGVLQGPTPSYVLDPEAGTVTFGDQLQGMVPPAGRRIRVRSMRIGGGSAGNLPAGSINSIQATDPSGAQIAQTIKVLQPIATTGGQEPETLASAERRLPSLLRHQDRAVTASDYASLAMTVPGANVGRVEVLRLFKPQTRTPDVPGVVSVMLIPGKDGVLNPCPRADRPLLETVYAFLSPRTPATAEMYVVASEYVALSLSVAVEVKAGFGILAVSQAVETAIRSYLWPLAPGGPASTGWPLGRVVRSLELEVVVSQVPGVIEINGLNLFQELANSTFQQIATGADGRSQLVLLSYQLPELFEVIVIAGPDGSGVAASTTVSTPTETDSTVAVPIVPNVC